MNLYTILLIYTAVINIYGFSLMYADKQNSIKKQWRVPEKKIFIISLLLGSLGTYAGMIIFHHKTRHWYFKYGIPIIITLQFLAIIYLNYRGLISF